MTFNVEEIEKAAGGRPLTVQLVKEHLPIMYVLEANGHFPAKTEGTTFKYLSPFRQDSDPSFDVFVDKKGETRFGDFAVGEDGVRQGDVIDLIGRFFELTMGKKPTFTQSIDEARKYIEQMKESGWVAPTVKPRKAFDLEAAKDLYAKATDEPNIRLLELFVTKRNDLVQHLDVEWLTETFRLGAVEDRIIAPYLDRAGELVAYKHRIIGGPMMSPPGAGIFDNVLYGEWLDTDPSLPVVLCEGESDTWVARSQLGPQYAVLGLPTGAAAQPKQAPTLAGRTVFLAFDADKAGKGGCRRWSAALEGDVRFVSVPEGKDLAKCPNIADMVLRATRPHRMPDDAFEVTGKQYYRKAPNEKTPPRQVSNFVFTPHRVMRSADGGQVYEGEINVHDAIVTLGAGDLTNANSLNRWAERHSGSWLGTDLDARTFQAMLQAEADFLPEGRMTLVAGLNDGQFVWPGGQLGHDRWTYVPPVNDIQIADKLRLRKEPWSLNTFRLMRELHQHGVTDPLLCWLATAPLRPLMPQRQFPIFALTGPSGLGKSNVVEHIVRIFSGSSIQLLLTSSTPHAVESHLSATNAFPVHIDEYRPGARKEALERLNQLLRDVYTMQPSAKGGQDRNNVSKNSLLVPSVPLIISGEESFSETSHTERMVQVSLPKEGRNPAVLDALIRSEQGPFAFAYLQWLYERYIEDSSTLLTIAPAGPETLPPRSRHNLGVIKFGWDLLQQFFADHNSVLEGQPDLSLVVTQAVESSLSNPIRDAIIWALGETDPDAGVFQTSEHIAIRPETFVAFINRKGTFVLPGGPKAVRNYLIAMYQATDGGVSIAGRTRKALLVAPELLGD